MKKSVVNDIVKHAEALSDEQLLHEYYYCLFQSLGSQCERMYDLGYDESDIIERSHYEDFISQKADILASLCEGRGLRLFDCIDRVEEEREDDLL